MAAANPAVAPLPEPQPLPVKRSALDRQMDELVGVPPRAWTTAAWQTAVGTIVVLAGTTALVALLRDGLGYRLGHATLSLIGLAGEGCLLGVALVAARRVRTAAGGWGAALGWVRPTRRDLWWGAFWVVVQLAAAVIVYEVFVALVPAGTLHASRNLRAVSYQGPVWLIVTMLTAVVVAPIAEETQCRGVLLRAGMRRWSFSRSALLSSLFFGLLHADQAGSVGGAVVLTVTIAVFGFLQCVLVRITGRLAPAAVAHGLNNGLGLLAALSR